jgi:hypothetical protein
VAWSYERNEESKTGWFYKGGVSVGCNTCGIEEEGDTKKDAALAWVKATKVPMPEPPKA